MGTKQPYLEYPTRIGVVYGIYAVCDSLIEVFFRHLVPVSIARERAAITLMIKYATIPIKLNLAVPTAIKAGNFIFDYPLE